MLWAHIGSFVWHLALCILPAFAWLLVCRVVFALRRRVGLSHAIAALLVLLTSLLSHKGTSLEGLAAAALAGVAVYIHWRRSIKRHSLEVRTIISYENYDRD